MLIVHRLAGIRFQMEALDPHLLGFAAFQLEQDRSFANNWLVVLADLVAQRHIGVEVVLSGKNRPLIDLCLQTKTGAYRLLNAMGVDHGQHAGKTGIQ